MEGNREREREENNKERGGKTLTRHLSDEEGHVTAWLSSNLEQPLQLRQRRPDATGTSTARTASIHTLFIMSCYGFFKRRRVLILEQALMHCIPYRSRLCRMSPFRIAKNKIVPNRSVVVDGFEEDEWETRQMIKWRWSLRKTKQNSQHVENGLKRRFDCWNASRCLPVNVTQYKSQLFE